VSKNINGAISFKQNKSNLQTYSFTGIDHLNINKTDLGDLKFDIEGDQNLEKFTINSFLENENFESLMLLVSKLSIKRRFLT
jgi:hypothetical protein